VDGEIQFSTELFVGYRSRHRWSAKPFFLA
jgi:hypothetical protein